MGIEFSAPTEAPPQTSGTAEMVLASVKNLFTICRKEESYLQYLKQYESVGENIALKRDPFGEIEEKEGKIKEEEKKLNIRIVKWEINNKETDSHIVKKKI